MFYFNVPLINLPTQCKTSVLIRESRAWGVGVGGYKWEINNISPPLSECCLRERHNYHFFKNRYSLMFCRLPSN